MKKGSKALLCSVIASLGIIGAGSFGTLLTYADDAEILAVASQNVVYSGWTTDESGRIFYYDENGLPLTGIQEIEGQKYLFAANGVLKTGWRTIDEKRYYFNPETGKAEYGWIEYEGDKFYVSKDNGKVAGYFADPDGSFYIFDEYGSMYSGNKFVNVDGIIYYVGADGKLLTETTVIEDVPYIFASNGRMKTGWRTYNDKRYYYNPETGERMLGLIEYEGKYYFVTAEKGKCSGTLTISGIDYLFNNEFGYMETGWQTVNGAKHYYFENGKAAVGLETIDGYKYYFAADGIMQTGWQTVNGTSYYFTPEGKMASGWQTIDGVKYYFTSEGKLATGWQTIDGKRYLFSSEGKIQTGWQTADSSKYYLGSDGAALTGLQTVSGSKYYFAADGKMQTGWQTIDGAKYYIASDGKVQTGWQTVDGAKYYFAADGKMLTGWQTIDGKKYHFNTSTGVMSVNTSIDGYTIGADGVAVKLSAVQVRANEIIASIGADAQNIFSYVRNHNKYKFIEETKSLQQIESIGWSYFADYSIDNRFIVCYYFAAVTDVLYKQAGFETRIVYGTGRGEGEHYWNQIKVNGVWTNYDTCNGYANVTDEFLKAQNYTWYQFIYPVYN